MNILTQPITGRYGIGRINAWLICLLVALIVYLNVTPNYRKEYNKEHCEIFRSKARTTSDILAVERMQIEPGTFCLDVLKHTY